MGGLKNLKHLPGCSCCNLKGSRLLIRLVFFGGFAGLSQRIQAQWACDGRQRYCYCVYRLENIKLRDLIVLIIILHNNNALTDSNWKS